MAKQYRPWTEMLSLTPQFPTTFTMVHPPERMGNALPIAYGGFALAAAIKSAGLTLPSAPAPTYHLYSCTGNYLGPASVDRPLQTSVRVIRQTRTFATRLVEVFQEQTNSKDGKTEKRAVLIALADFQVREKASLLVYSAPPSRTYTHFSKLQDVEEQQRKMVQEGKVSQELVDEHNTAFGLAKSLFQARQCPEGFFGQTLMGMVKELPTTQDSLPLTERSTADWVRSREMVPSEDQTEQVTMMAFFMDGAIAFCPLTFSHMFLDDSAATSSLEFALRVFSNDIDMNKWQLREIKTVVGAEGRTYSEGKLWEDGGRCVASMTQQSIMRPKREKQKGKGKL